MELRLSIARTYSSQLIIYIMVCKLVELMSENCMRIAAATLFLVAILCGCTGKIIFDPLPIEPVDYCYHIQYVPDPEDSSIDSAKIQFFFIVENKADTPVKLPMPNREFLVSANIVHQTSGAISSRDLGVIRLDKELKAVIPPHTRYTLRGGSKLLKLKDGESVDVIELYDPSSEKNSKIYLGSARDWIWFDDNQKERSCDINDNNSPWVELKISLNLEDCDWQSNPHRAFTCPPDDNVRLCWRSGPSERVDKVIITYPDGKRLQKEPNGYEQPVNVKYAGKKEVSFKADAYDVNNQVIASDTVKLIFIAGGEELGKFYADYYPKTRTFAARLEDEISPKIRVLQYTLIGCSFKGGPVQVRHWSYPQYNSGTDYAEVINGVPPITKSVQNPFFAKGKWEFALQETAPEPPQNVDTVYLCFSIKGDCA